MQSYAVHMPECMLGMHCRSSQAANAARSIADTVQCFITAMDSLKLGMSAVDEVSALLRLLTASDRPVQGHRSTHTLI